VLAADQPRTTGAANPAEGQFVADDPNNSAAVRIFKQGAGIVYGYEILNAQTDREKKPQLLVQTRLFRDGQEVYTGAPSPMNTEGQRNPQRLISLGSMKLGQSPPGDYVLQVIVTDKLAKEKNRIAAQSMDFEIRQ
jgi:hypothetical protein